MFCWFCVLMEKVAQIDVQSKIELKVQVYESLDSCATEWDSFGCDSIFLQSSFLRSIERCPPKGLVPYYVFFIDAKGQIRGKAYFQNKTFKASESLKVSKNTNCPSFFSNVGYYLKQVTTRKVEFESLCCGHITLSGPYAYRFDEGITRAQQHVWIDKAIHEVTEVIHSKGKEVSIILMKDFPTHHRFTERTGEGPKFFEFQIQPSMILKIRENWESVEDYLSDMTSKYRVRYKRAKKKMKGLTRTKMSCAQVQENKETMFELYKMIANNSGFNLFSLDADYISILCEELGDRIQIHGYWDGAALIGFTTLILDEDAADAHIIGFDNKYNHSHQLYQNMLYDMVADSITAGVNQLDFARTALEIKSTVGAEPEELYCYMRHQKPIHNVIVPKLFKLLDPGEEWVQRHPFK